MAPFISSWNDYDASAWSLQDNASEEFTHDTEQRHAVVVVTVASATLVLVESDDVDISSCLVVHCLPSSTDIGSHAAHGEGFPWHI